MKNVIIRSAATTKHGTFGDVIFPNGWRCVSLELPWRDNKSGISCIPAGTYKCIMVDSPKHGPVYELQNVPDRTHIQIHSANFAGDISLNMKSDLLGCIAFGMSIGIMDGQLAIKSSKQAMYLFMEQLKREPFTLTINRS